MNTHALMKFKKTKDLAHWYDQKYTDMGKGWDCPRSEALKYLAFMGITEKQEKCLLDIGCGQGHFTAIANEFVQARGIDISPVVVSMASQAYPDVGFSLVDIEHPVELRSLQFDYIASIGSIEHCIDIPQAVKSVYELLVPGGIFYALVPNEEWQHFDQPNEVTHTDQEWLDIFREKSWRFIKHNRIGDISHFLFQKEEA